MDKPLKFAKFLLKQRGLYEDLDMDRILGGRERVRAKHVPGQKWKYAHVYKPVYIDDPIPVHVDYFTTRVDDEGRTHFYADIYDKDADELESDEGE